jgi:hypothetical protein
MAVIERMFQHTVGGPNRDEEELPYNALVRDLVDDAAMFEESTLMPDREENLQYFYGETPAPEGEGTSTAISTDFRDTVMAIIPSLMRIFTSAEHVISCQPNYAGQEEAAKQCTDYLQYMFWEDNPGFLILHDVFKDSLRCKIGVVKWWTETEEEVTQQTYRNITHEQVQLLISENPSVEVVEARPSKRPPMGMGAPPVPIGGAPAPEASPDPAQSFPGMGEMPGIPPPGSPEMGMPGPMGPPPPPPPPQIFEEVTLRFVKSKPITKIESVPLDEFRIDRRAKNAKSAQLIGHDRITNVGELISAGYEMDVLEEHLGATQTFSVDRQFRNKGLDETSVQDNLDIRYGCYFIRIDKDGDGIPELREIHTVGDNHVIIHDEVVQHANYAVFCSDPEPHTVIGDSPAELVKDIQVIKTNMLRGSLDSLAQSIWPRTVFNETLVNAEDVLNEEIGAAIRTRGDPATTVQSLQHLFIGQPVFQMFEVMEVLRQQRTGISDASKGVDPKALQSTALQGVDAIVTGAQERIELCARVLAETGMKDLFQGLLRECVNSPNQERTVQLRGKWTEVNPSTFDPTMKISVNPTLGRGSDMTRLMVLQDIKQTQMLTMEKYGVDNPLCGPMEFRNTLTDMMAIGNIKNVDRYFKVITPEIMAQISQTPKEPDPALMLAQAEMEKTRSKTATEIAKREYEDRKLRVDDDFRRDQLTVKSILDAATVEGQWGEHVDGTLLEMANVANALDKIDNEAANTDAGIIKTQNDIELGQRQADIAQQGADTAQQEAANASADTGP